MEFNNFLNKESQFLILDISKGFVFSWKMACEDLIERLMRNPHPVSQCE